MEIYHYQDTSVTPVNIGSFGEGPWVGFAEGHGGPMYALNSSGEIWAMSWFGVPSLHASLPGEMAWCALLTGNSTGPQLALSCTGEIWSTGDTPEYYGRMSSVVSAAGESVESLKQLFH